MAKRKSPKLWNSFKSVHTYNTNLYCTVFSLKSHSFACLRFVLFSSFSWSMFSVLIFSFIEFWSLEQNSVAYAAYLEYLTLILYNEATINHIQQHNFFKYVVKTFLSSKLLNVWVFVSVGHFTVCNKKI